MQIEVNKPEVAQRAQAYIESGRFHDTDELLTKAFDALDEKTPANPARPRTGQDLIDASAKVRGLLTDEEVDTIFSRNKSGARPVNFE